MTDANLIRLQERRILEIDRIETAIAADMHEAVTAILGELRQTHSLRQIARRIHRSPEYLSRVECGHEVCSRPVFLELCELWRKAGK